MRSLEVVLTFKSDVKRFKVIKAVKCYPNCVTAIFSASFNECIHYTRCTALLFRLRFFINAILIDRNYCKITSGTKLVCHCIQATCIAMNFQDAVIYSALPPFPPQKTNVMVVTDDIFHILTVILVHRNKKVLPY